MTSTPFNVGLKGERNSSRVLRPPGGGHTDIFGVAEPIREKPSPQEAPVLNEEKPTNGTAHIQEPQEAKEAAPVDPPTPEPSPEATACTAVEKNNEEPPKKESPKQEAPRVDPPRRVKVPPGGFSSGLW